LKGKVVLFSQTTMSKDLFYRIKEEIEKKVEELILIDVAEETVEFIAKDTICRQVANRDDKLKEFSKREGIFQIKVWINEGELKVGDDIMLVLVAGRYRRDVLPTFEELIDKIKKEIVKEEEVF